VARALILVDIQNDFMPGGPLAVPAGDEVVPIVNQLTERFEVVVATQDYHPRGHGSFASMHPGRAAFEVAELDGLAQVLWPDHCVASTPGAELVSGLDTSRVAAVFQKGTDPNVDSYSGFFDNGRRKGTGLDVWLRERGVTEVFIVGVATDYCVLATARDARSLGFSTTVVLDACRGVDLASGDVARAIEEMRQMGVRIALAQEVDSESLGD